MKEMQSLRGIAFSGLIVGFVVGAAVVIPVDKACAASLDEIQQAIQEKQARWTAGKTNVSNLPDEQKKNLAGTIISGANKNAPPAAQAAAALPAVFDWRTQNKVSPIRDQGNCGSCWAFGSVAALESLAMIQGEASPDYSEQFVVSYNLKNDGCDGGYMNNVYNFLKQVGTPDEECKPYEENDNKSPTPCGDWKTQLAGVESWSWVNQSVADLKAAVYVNPIAAAFDVYDDFFSYVSGVYEHVTGDYAGGHAILIVGWDDAKQCFIVKNSWGEEWGEDGFFRIAYSQVINEVSFGSDAGAFDNIK